MDNPTSEKNEKRNVILNILHYSLGFPPYRTGGLTKYCMDLMKAQVACGNKVGLLWPGRMQINGTKVKVKQGNAVDGIANYEIINPLPVSLDEGIIEVEAYTKSCNIGVFVEILEVLKPEVIFIHTFMGLYKELVLAARQLSIKTVFIVHDYFGICPKVTLFTGNKPCECDTDCTKCVSCNQSALSLNKIRILQSPLYRNVKNTKIVKVLRKKHRTEFYDTDTSLETYEKVTGKTGENYVQLRKFYTNILGMMDLVLFNSTLTRDIYLQYCSPRKWEVFPISHLDIADNRVEKKFGEHLRITFLAPAKSYKGYAIVKNALKRLYREGNDKFTLTLYQDIPDKEEFMVCKEPYSYEELSQIMEQTDLLLAPSVWYETFGFTVLEAYSYGVPIVVSDNTGAKDLIRNGENGWVVDPTEEALYDVIKQIYVDRNMLKKCNQEILHESRIPGVPMENLLLRVKEMD